MRKSTCSRMSGTVRPTRFARQITSVAGAKDAGDYTDVKGFCKSATLEDIRAHGHVLTPGRYVGAEDAEDDSEPFEEKMKRLTSTLDEQFTESARLENVIRKNLENVAYGG